MDKTNKINRPIKNMLWHNFLGGIAWALGVTIGATVIFAILGFILSKINYVPVVGNFILQINDFISKNGSNLLQ